MLWNIVKVTTMCNTKSPVKYICLLRTSVFLLSWQLTWLPMTLSVCLMWTRLCLRSAGCAAYHEYNCTSWQLTRLPKTAAAVLNRSHLWRNYVTCTSLKSYHMYNCTSWQLTRLPKTAAAVLIRSHLRRNYVTCTSFELRHMYIFEVVQLHVMTTNWVAQDSSCCFESITSLKNHTTSISHVQPQVMTTN